MRDYDDNGKLVSNKPQHIKGVTPCLFCLLPCLAGLTAAWYFQMDASDMELQKYWDKTKGVFKPKPSKIAPKELRVITDAFTKDTEITLPVYKEPNLA